jgi:Family of unknown function (DUF5996)
MNPSGVDLHAFLALPLPRRLHLVDRVNVRARVWHNREAIMSDDRWPALPFDAWNDTYATLHMWSQVVGKVALATAVPLNHSWGITLHLTARGLSTGVLSKGKSSFTIEFDFIQHELVIRTADGRTQAIALAPMPVAEFYRQLMASLKQMSLDVTVWPMAVEIPSPIRLDTDTEHHSYDPVMANRFWRILLAVGQVFSASRSHFVGKCSPVHFFWGSFDLAVTRFSGRPAPPCQGPLFMREAYSHEVISHGFWPGSGPVLEAAFYSYAVPEPAGLKEARIRPAGAYYHRELREFIFPYEAARTSPSPEEAIAEFIASTYDAAADLGRWDRRALERSPG